MTPNVLLTKWCSIDMAAVVLVNLDMKKTALKFSELLCTKFLVQTFQVHGVQCLAINYQSNEISIKRRKSQHQAEQLERYFDASTTLCQSRIADRKRKTAFQLSKRKLNLTIKSSYYRSKIVSWKETFDACSVIHGGLSLRSDPVIEGMVHALNSKFRTKQVNSKSKLPTVLTH